MDQYKKFSMLRYKLHYYDKKRLGYFQPAPLSYKLAYAD